MAGMTGAGEQMLLMRKLLMVQVDDLHTLAFSTSALANLVRGYVGERLVG